MGRIGGMIGRYGLSGLALLLTASCVAPEHSRAPTPRADPIASAAPLLRRLALDVPKEEAIDSPIAPASDSELAAATRAAPPFLGAPQTEADAARALQCLAEAVYYEARSESIDGQRAVAQVVLNRVRDRAFPRSICGVVHQGSERATGCQFSFTCDGSTAWAPGGAAWLRALAVAQAALDGSVYAPVGSATFYHTRAVHPWWADSFTQVGTIGAHIFYRWRSALERALAFRQTYAGYEPGTFDGVTRVRGPGAMAVAEENGVTVHRGGSGGSSGNASSDAARVIVTSNVRVHYGAASSVTMMVPEHDEGAAIEDGADPA
jgi:spore germination cell wall hydrolase CwlJ-like protein